MRRGLFPSEEQAEKDARATLGIEDRLGNPPEICFTIGPDVLCSFTAFRTPLGKHFSQEINRLGWDIGNAAFPPGHLQSS
jgi:hypothetical protein